MDLTIGWEKNNEYKNRNSGGAVIIMDLGWNLFLHLKIN